MIARIDHECDVDIYLKEFEVKDLSEKTIEGILIKNFKPKLQGKIYLSVNDSRSYENGFGIGVCDEKYFGVNDNFEIEFFMGTEFYQDVLGEGVIGMRQRMRDGSKIQIYDCSKIDQIILANVENLEFYRDNRDRLPEHFG